MAAWWYEFRLGERVRRKEGNPWRTRVVAAGVVEGEDAQDAELNARALMRGMGKHDFALRKATRGEIARERELDALRKAVKS